MALRETLSRSLKSGVLTNALDWHKRLSRLALGRTWPRSFSLRNKERLRKQTAGGMDITLLVTLPRPLEGITNETLGLYYCCSHGLEHSKDHTSLTCTHKVVGHQNTSTIKNMMGSETLLSFVASERIVFRRLIAAMAVLLRDRLPAAAAERPTIGTDALAL
jgi:hypothetical protein